MIMNELNTNLIEAAKEKFPAKGQLANILMDTLYMGKEAIYRRLRGEVPFTFQEAAIISKELGISLDRIAGVSFSNNAMFDINVVDHATPSKLTMISSTSTSSYSIRCGKIRMPH
jgi:DNA-binding phage protein